MATYYIDLSLTGTGTGTEIDPFTRDQFCSVINGSQDTFNVRGVGTITSVSNITGIGAGAIIRKWGSDPWRLRASVSSPWLFQYVTISDGVLYHDCPVPGGGPTIALIFNDADIKNCDIRTNDWLRTGNIGVSSTFKGCNILAKYTGLGLAKSSIFNDTILIISSSLAAGLLTTFNNCVTNRASWSLATANNCQLSWTPPAWPDWDATIGNWTYSVLSVGITTPQPGNPPYTGYETDLWGNARIGIGNGDMAVLTFPIITSQPSSIAKNVGETGAFSVTATGMQPLTYEWRKGGVGLTGSTLNEYIIYPVAAADGGSYDVYVTETGGVTGANSDTATLTVKPNITVQPISLIKNVGQSAMFSVTAEGYPTPTYQWKKGVSDILGATSSSYTIDPVAASDGGSYTVVVTNSGGSVTSSAATLTVTPNITIQPISLVKSVGQSATFSVTAEGYPTPTYQWKKGVSDILGATSSSYTINPVAASNSGSYTVAVTNSGGSVTSSAATLTVIPNILTQPVSQTVAPLDDVTFTVVAEGTATLTYQWQKNHVNISGATTSSLLLENVSESDQANYRAVVTNTGGSATSSDAYLNVGDIKKDAETDNPDDVVGMPAFHSNSPSMRLRDTQLGTGDLRNTLERNKINHIGNEARDTGFGSSDGARARNHENTNEVKGLLQRMSQLVETITTFFYRIR
jgi:hypothetical protein